MLIPVQIKIVRGNKQLGEDTMRYPKGYNAEIVEQWGGPTYGKTVHLGQGDAEEFCVILVEQWYLDELTKDATKAGEMDRVVVLTELEVGKFFTDNVPEKDEIVNDKARLELLAYKSLAGIALTPIEKKAFDPSHASPGVVKGNREKWRRFKDLLDKSKV